MMGLIDELHAVIEAGRERDGQPPGFDCVVMTRSLSMQIPRGDLPHGRFGGLVVYVEADHAAAMRRATELVVMGKKPMVCVVESET